MARRCLLLCMVFLIADRWSILHQFGFRFTDDDQTIMWSGAVEMAHGRFHEPCFYGQRYNSMLEGLLAVPFLWCGLRADVALPLVTSMLTLFPFVLLAVVLAKQRAHVLAAFALVYPVTLSPEFGMITCMPRGFVTGVFLASFTILPLFSARPVWLIAAPFFAVLAVFANPNAVLVLLPVGSLIAWRYRRHGRTWLLALAVAAPAVIFYRWSRGFYLERPAFVVHPDPDLTYHVPDIRWDDVAYLDNVSPLLWGKGLFVFIILLGFITWFGARRRWSEVLALTATLLLIIVSFGVRKIHNGTTGVFFPYARMFMAVPFLLMLFVAQLKVRNSMAALWAMPMLAATFLGYKCIVQHAAIERQLDPRIDEKVEMAAVADLHAYCARMGRVAAAVKADVIVLSWPRYKHMSNYGCPCLIPGFPITLEHALDRRTWLLRDMAARVVPRVLLTGMGSDHFARLRHVVPPAERVEQDTLFFLVRNDSMRFGPLLDSLGVGLRAH